MKIPIRLHKLFLYIVIISAPYLLMAENNNLSDKVELQEDVVIKGEVYDELGNPLIGASIVQQGTSRGTTAGFSGEFSLRVKYNSNIEISYIGYQTKVISNITAPADLKITLNPDTTNLNEIVIVGFAKQTKQTLIGAVESVKGKALEQVGSVSTVSESLQGALPGLTVINSNGKPGSDAASIYLRGRSSWQGSGGPLTLVDGIERDINNLDPNEIESISVLKDASATAVYGVRGANGVILVTTKRGEIGKPKFNFTTNIGFKKSTAEPNYIDYITAQKLYNEAAINTGAWEQLIPQSTIDAWTQNYDQRGPNNIYFPEINWTDEVLGIGTEQTYNLNMSGGSKLIRYFVSLGYRNDGDIFKTTPQEEYDPAFNLKKYNWRSNFDFDVTPTTKLSVNFSGNYRLRQQPGYRIDGNGEDGFGQSQFFNLLYSAPRNVFPIEYEDGYGDSSNGESNLIMALNEGGVRKYRYYQGFYDAQVTQGLDFLTKGLSLKGSINYTSSSSYESRILRGNLGSANVGIIRYYREYDYSNPIVAADGSVTYPIINEIRYPTDVSQGTTVTATTPNLYSYSRRLNYKFQMDYKRLLGDHKVSANAIMWRQSDTGRTGYKSVREEWIGRLNYYYKQRYLLEVNGSYSGSEKFAPGQRFGFFPSLGVGWVASEEPFIKSFAGSWLDLLKVNYSYGITGDDNTDRFQYVQTFGTGSNVNFGYDGVTGYGPRYTEGQLANANSTWEESEVHNLSFKFEAFKKLTLGLDFYRELRTGILMSVRIPAYVGVTGTAQGNLGKVKKHGYEFQVGWKDNITEDLTYGINFNTAFSENRVLDRNDPRLQLDYLNEAGKPIGWTSRYLEGGLYQSLDDVYNGATPNLGTVQSQITPGDAMFIDYNGDGEITNADLVAMDQNIRFPLNTYSLGINIGYKNFSASANFYGVTNVGYIIPNAYYFDFGGFIQANEDVVNRWTPETAATATKPALHTTNTHNTQSSTLTYTDGSYVRLKSAEISYRFTKGIIKQLGLKSAQLYANGNNLFTWSKLGDQMDPESSGTGNYPIVKRYSLGLRVSF
ncbi:SusC/RagA family TonB-linked outer membrane protein [Polaribacter sargassicola]|uniref:SusC/RagA family TonB-linked outer membrane protein n=1 Tax=Polaribacter sargassicola TaxID=2836891 RepID=UPI001F1E8EA4|nr:TonB-dependent receptor [Polaribacter sp. DS7-9]MCG1035817.1 TonB-dependent receptor [Polaribacter sp. DS7-9]